MEQLPEKIFWDICTFVYRRFADTTHAPSVDETAARFALAHEEAASAYEALNNLHTFFLCPGTHDILMANPFSNIETSFRVHAKGKTYFANCAWDSLGIPAALHCAADVEATCSQSGEQVSLQVRDGHVSESAVLAHFLVPFEYWYDDLVFT
jgi:hypothetical protein